MKKLLPVVVFYWWTVGELLFLIIPGNTPAQSIYLLKNLKNPSIFPGYNLNINSEIYVPGFTFAILKFVRFK